ncbi:MAG: sulfatase, partial [Planctomycetota bacterium]
MTVSTMFQRQHTRRQLLTRSGTGVGLAALATLLGENGAASSGLGSLPHFAPKAKRVIYLLQNGAPS